MPRCEGKTKLSAAGCSSCNWNRLIVVVVVVLSVSKTFHCQHGYNKMDSSILRFPIFMDSTNRAACVQQAEEITTAIRSDFKKPFRHKFFSESYTNTILGVWGTEPGKNDKILFRIFGHKTELIIDRLTELKYLRALHSANCAPPFYGCFDNGFIYGFVPGKPMTPISVRHKHNVNLITKAMAELHKAVPLDPSRSKEPFVFIKIEAFVQQLTVKDHEGNIGYSLPASYPSNLDLRKELILIRSLLTSSDVPVVLCHNDPQPGNIIMNEQEDRASFIDFEYCDFNYFTYDIADHFCEFGGIENPDFSLFPCKSFMVAWLKSYLKWWNEGVSGNNNNFELNSMTISDVKIEKFLIHIRICAAAAHFLWSLWSIIQAQHSDIDFDYIRYGQLRMEEYLRIKNEINSSFQPINDIGLPSDV